MRNKFDLMLGTYCISASHSKKLSSLIGPATIPSGGFNVNSVQSHQMHKVGKWKKIYWNAIRSSEANEKTKKLQNVLIFFNTLQYLRLYSAIKRRNDEPAILFIHNLIQSMKSACQFVVAIVYLTNMHCLSFLVTEFCRIKVNLPWLKWWSRWLVVLVNFNNFFFVIDFSLNNDVCRLC